MRHPMSSRAGKTRRSLAHWPHRLFASAGVVAVAAWLAVPSYAARFIATPEASTMPSGKYSLWQFVLHESRSTDDIRLLNRIDVGLSDRLELGVFIINPRDKPTDTWVNLQFKVLQEADSRPVVSVGVWDAAEISQFSGESTGGSFFVAAGKTFKPHVDSWSPPHLKVSIAAGTNRLNGLFGGFDLRAVKNTGVMVELAPANLRLPGTCAVDAGLYQWFGEHWRGRVSYMGGNPMLDVFYTSTIGK